MSNSTVVSFRNISHHRKKVWENKTFGDLCFLLTSPLVFFLHAVKTYRCVEFVFSFVNTVSINAINVTWMQ